MGKKRRKRANGIINSEIKEFRGRGFEDLGELKELIGEQDVDGEVGRLRCSMYREKPTRLGEEGGWLRLLFGF